MRRFQGFPKKIHTHERKSTFRKDHFEKKEKKAMQARNFAWTLINYFDQRFLWTCVLYKNFVLISRYLRTKKWCDHKKVRSWVNKHFQRLQPLKRPAFGWTEYPTSFRFMLLVLRSSSCFPWLCSPLLTIFILKCTGFLSCQFFFSSLRSI